MAAEDTQAAADTPPAEPTAPAPEESSGGTFAARRGSIEFAPPKSRRGSFGKEAEMETPPKRPKTPVHPPTVTQLIQQAIIENKGPLYALQPQGNIPPTTIGMRTGVLNPRGPIGIGMSS